MVIKESAEIVGNVGKAINPLYISENGDKYYNCRCLEHHQSMILKYTDIEAYNHNLCNNKNSLFIGSKDINSVTFTKKRRIKE